MLLTYKDAAGIWHEDRFRPIVTALINLVLNLVLVQFLGIYGVLLATVISKVCVGMPWLFHNLSTVLFKRSMRDYILKMLGYTVITAIVCLITYIAGTFISIGGVLGLIVKFIICLCISNLLCLLVYFKTREFGEAKELAMRILKIKN